MFNHRSLYLLEVFRKSFVIVNWVTFISKHPIKRNR